MSLTIPSDDAEQILDAYLGGRLAPSGALDGAVADSNARFVAVVLVHSYTTHTTETVETFTDADGFSYSELTVTATGELDGEVALIDADSRTVWWRGDHVEDADNTVTYSDDPAFWGLLEPGYPRPPERLLPRGRAHGSLRPATGPTVDRLDGGIGRASIRTSREGDPR